MDWGGGQGTVKIPGIYFQMTYCIFSWWICLVSFILGSKTVHLFYTAQISGFSVKYSGVFLWG